MPLLIEKRIPPTSRTAAYMKESPDFYYNKVDDSQVKDERSEKDKLLRLTKDQQWQLRKRKQLLEKESTQRLAIKVGDKKWAIFSLEGDKYYIQGWMNAWGEFHPHLYRTQEDALYYVKDSPEAWGKDINDVKVAQVVFNGLRYLPDNLPTNIETPLVNEPDLRYGQLEAHAGNIGLAIKRTDSGEYYVTGGIVLSDDGDREYQYDGDLVFRDAPSWGVFYDHHFADDIVARLRGIFQGVNFEIVDICLNDSNDWREVGNGGGPTISATPLVNEPDLRYGQVEEEEHPIEWAIKLMGDSLYVGVERNDFDIDPPEQTDEYWTVSEIALYGDPPNMFLWPTKEEAEKLAAKLAAIRPEFQVGGDFNRGNYKIVPVRFNKQTVSWDEIKLPSEPNLSPTPLVNEPDLRYGQTAPNTQFRNQDVQVDSGGPQPVDDTRHPYGYEGRGPTSNNYLKERGTTDTRDGQPSERDLEDDYETIWLRARTRVYMPKGVIPENAMVEIMKKKSTNEYTVKSISDSQGISTADIKGVQLPSEMVESGNFFEIPAEGNVVNPATDYPSTVSTEVKDSPNKELDQSFWGLNKFQREP